MLEETRSMKTARSVMEPVEVKPPSRFKRVYDGREFDSDSSETAKRPLDKDECSELTDRLNGLSSEAMAGVVCCLS